MPQRRPGGGPGSTKQRSSKAVVVGVTATMSRAGEAMGAAAGFAVLAATVALAWRKIGDFDTWWHLASGRWIATHHTVPAVDTLSHTVRDHAWINLQWGFDLALYALERVGGAGAVCLAGALVFTTAIALVWVTARRYLGRGLSALVVLLVLLAAQERILLRPEQVTFLLLAAVLYVLDRGRGTEGRGLWRLVPLMIVWVNVHALFALGVFAILCAVVGTLRRPSRPLLLWGGAALASVILNPYGITGVLFPLKLLTRINGSNPVFQTVGEFAGPFAAGLVDASTDAYALLLVLGCASAAVALALSFRRTSSSDGRMPFDWGGLVLFVGFAAVSVAARRNIAVFAIGVAPFIARCLGDTLAAWPAWRARLVRVAPVAGAVVLVAGVVLACTAVTGLFYKWNREPEEFGGGIIAGFFPERAAAFARTASLPPALYNDVLGGGYLAWDDPFGQGVFVDGRLEVYDEAFLGEYAEAVADPSRWNAEASRYGIDTAIICHRNEADRALISRLVLDTTWTLVYTDETAVVFVRTAGHADAIARAAARRPASDATTEAWLNAPVTRWPYPAGRVEGTHAYARVLATTGSADGAIAAYQKLLELGILTSDEIDVRLLLARYFANHGRTADAQDQARRVLALSPTNAEAQALVR